VVTTAPGVYSGAPSASSTKFPMSAKIIFPTALVALAAVIILLILLPTERPNDGPETLPWAVTVDAQGRTHALGFTLGETPLREVERRLREQGELSLFVAANGTMGVEAYIQEVALHGFRAKMVLTMAADQALLQAFYGRGLRITTSSSGDKRVTLSPEDMETVRGLPIQHITYLPATRLDPEIVALRFGEPAERITDQEGATHWLYPDRGMDVALDERGKTVIQYGQPAEFETMRAPLDQAAEAAQQ